MHHEMHMHSSGGEEGGGMAMTFNSIWKIPILFDSWHPTTREELFGALLAIFVAAFTLRGLMAARTWLELRKWPNQTPFVQKFNWKRDLARAGMAAVTAILSYGLMLTAMTYVVVNESSRL